MAFVTLEVGGRHYDLACRDGEEARLTMLAQLVDRKAEDAARAVGNANEARQLLLAALLLADEISDLRAGEADPGGAALARALEGMARRIETFADRLEKAGDAS